MAPEREKMGDTDRCPGKATLEAFVVGNVAADEIEHLAEHLKSCKECASGLAALDGYHDDPLAQLGTMPECIDDPSETLPAEERAKIRFIHLNHTNPALDPDSTAALTVRIAGFAVENELERTPL